MSDFLTRLDENRLTDEDCRRVRALLRAVGLAEQVSTRLEVPPAGEWRSVAALAEALEAT